SSLGRTPPKMAAVAYSPRSPRLRGEGGVADVGATRLAILPLVFWYWLFVGPAIVLAFLSLRGERKRADYVAARLAAPPGEHLPPATVIVPVKGEDDGLRENLAALASLDYPDYELIVAAHSAADIPGGVLP